MLKFLQTATKVAELTYKLATTTVLISALTIGVVKHIRDSRES